jgi:hypothetical protein
MNTQYKVYIDTGEATPMEFVTTRLKYVLPLCEVVLRLKVEPKLLSEALSQLREAERKLRKFPETRITFGKLLVVRKEVA